MPIPDQYVPDAERYDGRMPYRRCGRSGLQLPAVSLGFWHNFGDDKPLESQRAIMRRAFDLGHHPLRPREQLRPAVRDRRAQRRPDPGARTSRPARRAGHLEQGRLGHVAGAVRRPRLAQVPARQPRPEPGPAGPGLRRHLLQPPARSRHPARGDDGRAAHGRPAGQGAVRGHLLVLAEPHARRPPGSSPSMGTPLLIHQPSYSMFNRWIEGGLLDTLQEVGAGCITFSPLAQGLLTDRYLDGVPADSRAAAGKSMSDEMLSDENLDRIRVAGGDRRGPRPVAGADGGVLDPARPPSHDDPAGREQRAPARGDRRGGAAGSPSRTRSSTEIDAYAVDADINLWAGPVGDPVMRRAAFALASACLLLALTACGGSDAPSRGEPRPRHRRRLPRRPRSCGRGPSARRATTSSSRCRRSGPQPVLRRRLGPLGHRADRPPAAPPGALRGGRRRSAWSRAVPRPCRSTSRRRRTWRTRWPRAAPTRRRRSPRSRRDSTQRCPPTASWPARPRRRGGRRGEGGLRVGAGVRRGHHRCHVDDERGAAQGLRRRAAVPGLA